MFIVKKIISPFLMPPGIFVALLLLSSLWFFHRKSRKAAAVNLCLALLVWLVSISPVSDAMLRGLETEFSIPRNPEGDVIILLGGGVNDVVPDLSGIGTPSEEMLGRIITAVRLQRRLDIPIIVSGGSVFKDKAAEAPIVKRFLVDLGVAERKVIIEEKSRDTIENARYTVEICGARGYSKPLLVSSASHMKRALLSFRNAGMEVSPFPAGFKSVGRERYAWEDFLPNAGELKKVSTAMREYAGLLYYRAAY
ncbi:MAG TPA: YdcF family protein [Thermodesulfovibrionales bacterium]|nr:YdcF family protein [Thermodesulfovibrionales bacterium]